MTYEAIRKDAEAKAYIQGADDALLSLGYTEHSFAHATQVSNNAGAILETLGFPPRDVELARIAAYLHDIGNMVNRIEHSQSGALMAFHLLQKHAFPPQEIAQIVSAIGNHDEGTGTPVNTIAAALILADKSDVRQSRVRAKAGEEKDIHDRVNGSVKKSQLQIDKEKGQITLNLSIDTETGSVMEYFEIFMDRMLLCRQAAEKLGLVFKLIINEQSLI